MQMKKEAVYDKGAFNRMESSQTHDRSLAIFKGKKNGTVYKYLKYEK